MNSFRIPVLIASMFILLCYCVCAVHAADEPLEIFPIHHGSMVLLIDDTTIYVDPVQPVTRFSQYPTADIIVITHTHHDHLSKEIVDAVREDTTSIIGPQSVIDTLGYGEVLNNGDSRKFSGITVEAIPAYNLTPARQTMHVLGEGNGYVLSSEDTRMYISGDTEDISEMRALTDIDYAVICMNLPYTMTVEQAASAVLAFKPHVVIPYHYRGKGMISDLTRFRELLSSSNANIEVRLLDWYDMEG